jgi:hypothetical protein
LGLKVSTDSYTGRRTESAGRCSSQPGISGVLLGKEPGQKQCRSRPAHCSGQPHQPVEVPSRRAGRRAAKAPNRSAWSWPGRAVCLPMIVRHPIPHRAYRQAVGEITGSCRARFAGSFRPPPYAVILPLRLCHKSQTADPDGSPQVCMRGRFPAGLPRPIQPQAAFGIHRVIPHWVRHMGAVPACPTTTQTGLSPHTHPAE